MISRIILAVFFCFNAVSWGQQYIISTVAGGIPPATPTDAQTASIGDPPRVAVDGAGNVYFGSLHSVFKVDRSGTLTRIAGNGRSGYTGDGGPATGAELTFPDGIAVDAAGNVYVSDRAAHVIRKIATSGVISTFAGTGKNGFSGDGAPAATAQLNAPTGVALDGAGNLYVADTDNSVIRKISTDGTIDTIAGTRERGYGGDGGPARDADLNQPQGVTVDGSGNLYIADTLNNRIRKVAPNGTITSFAGYGFPGGGRKDVPATTAALFLPTDVAADRSGVVYIADLGAVRIRKVTDGVISTVAGNNTAEQLAIDGVLAVSVRIKGPTGVAVDNAGNVYFASGSIGSGSGLNVGEYRIWKVKTDGMLQTVAGNGSNSYSGDGGPATLAQIETPAGMAKDSKGNLFFADPANHRVRKIAPDGTITTVAGFGVPGFAGEQGPAIAALLNTPMGVAIDPYDRLFIADTGNNRIREVLDNGTIGTYVGNGNAALYGDGGSPLDAALHSPRALVFDAEGNMYIADTLDHRIRKVDVNTFTIDTIVGSSQGFGGDGGPAVNARLNAPSAITVDSAGNLYIADEGNGRIRKVTRAGTISTVAGAATVFTGDGGPAINALVSGPRGVALDRSGNLYIAESGENRIRKVAPDGTISTVAGNGNCCYANDGGPATSAPLNLPWGLAMDAGGNIFVADTGNAAIRVLQPAPTGGTQSTVVSAGSFQTGPIAPGELVAITGTGLGPAQAAQFQASGGFVGTQLAGVSVLFNGIFAPVLYASANQVTAIVPYGAAGASAQVVVQFQSRITFTGSVPLAPAAPALLTADSTGRGQAAAINGGSQANDASHPAAVGSVVTLYATGEGLTSPAGVDGKLGVAPLPKPVLPVTVTIGGQAAQVQYAGGEAGTVAGILRLDVQVPSGIQTGPAVPVVLQVGGVSSPAGVTIAVQ